MDLIPIEEGNEDTGQLIELNQTVNSFTHRESKLVARRELTARRRRAFSLPSG
jgi:hypothetical protein